MLAEHCVTGGIAIVATHERISLDASRMTLGGFQ
jgi:ABC-type transport system involved in cytochrome c biogenesis ATPase subunit